MSAFVIREATPGDAEALVPVMACFGHPADPETIRARLLLLRAGDPTGRILVAESAGRLLGFMTLHLTPTLHRPTVVGRITALAVLPESRGSNAGRRLVEAAEEYFAGLGLSRVEVTSGPMHAPAHSFYRHLAYEDQGVRFAKVLTKA
jgi:GNAT superfamily N-acetyltransferase